MGLEDNLGRTWLVAGTIVGGLTGDYVVDGFDMFTNDFNTFDYLGAASGAVLGAGAAHYFDKGSRYFVKGAVSGILNPVAGTRDDE